MITCVARPIHSSEPCLLAGNEHRQLIIKNDDTIIKTISAPLNGWSYSELEMQCSNIDEGPGALDAYLGTQWIGSSEV